ncbi:putative FAD binding domain protein [Rosellinia necatrix]|uniref:Putative FAD binding domain protein n=1 Tax=Rosellinia necatrix TaxID=77044 RepID=A0A1W2TP39_ROSNE|nr:putative FAD binding domain protein [Rosellinia necatrix]
MFHDILVIILTCTWLLGSPAVGYTIDSGKTACKSIPGDRNWPSTADWDNLNATVNGRLIATLPIAHVCHAPWYSKQACDTLRTQWGVAELQTSQPAEFLAPWFQNQSCTPFEAEGSPCNLGNYASYSIEVLSTEDVITGVEFARKKNIRLVVKNTGHDLQGKSTGKGALSLWTRNMKDMELVSDYTSDYYKGPAIKMGAGVQIAEIVEFAASKGFRAVVGSCPTVGVAGGYSQGGGYGLLAGLYGLGSDNVLEWEVVTMGGKLVKATPNNEHSDLYWALSGGGGGTYGIAVSMTARVFEDGPVGSASFFFSAATTGSEEAYWDAVGIFHSHLPALVDQEGIVLSYSVSKDTLILYTMTAPNRTATEVANILAPLTEELGTAGLSLQAMAFNTTESPTFSAYYSGSLEPVLAASPISPVAGDRFISRANMMASDAAAASVLGGLRAATASGNFTLACAALNVGAAHTAVPPVAPNAASPAWRDVLATCIVGSVWRWGQPWDLVRGQQDELVRSVLPALEAATPGAGAYANEANFAQADWQATFYGDNYPRLRDIKSRYDPKGALYGVISVGSEDWREDQDGRLCRV